jgi:hypothetical protein
MELKETVVRRKEEEKSFHGFREMDSVLDFDKDKHFLVLVQEEETPTPYLVDRFNYKQAMKELQEYRKYLGSENFIYLPFLSPF